MAERCEPASIQSVIVAFQFVAEVDFLRSDETERGVLKRQFAFAGRHLSDGRIGLQDAVDEDFLDVNRRRQGFGENVSGINLQGAQRPGHQILPSAVLHADGFDFGEVDGSECIDAIVQLDIELAVLPSAKSFKLRRLARIMPVLEDSQRFPELSGMMA